MHLGNNIKVLRKKKGISQEELASKINKSKANVSLYERGKTLAPLDVIIEMCQIFEVSIDDLVFKNLAKEAGEGIINYEEQDKYAPDYKLMVKLLTDKILEVSEAIKEENPKLYEELGLDGIAEVVKG